MTLSNWYACARLKLFKLLRPTTDRLINKKLVNKVDIEPEPMAVETPPIDSLNARLTQKRCATVIMSSGSE